MLQSVWPSDWAIYWTWGNFLKINLTKYIFLGNFLKLSKSIIFLVKSFLGNFYRHLAIFFWSHCSQAKPGALVIVRERFWKKSTALSDRVFNRTCCWSKCGISESWCRFRIPLICSSRSFTWKIFWEDCLNRNLIWTILIA